MNPIADIYRKIADDARPEVFVHLRPQQDVMNEHAAALASGGTLAGLVLAVKDNVDVAGLPTTAGCPEYAYLARTDAPAVAALREAGAVVIGKTNLDQFATGLVGTRSPYGAVRDARRPDYISGGSSSGSAVAVALGYADIAVGTDTAGSGRVPAALQGIVGIKGTLRTVSTEGVVPACASYDTVTVFARDLPTANRAMTEMARTGTRSWSADTPLAAPPAAVIAVPDELVGLNAQWRDAFDRVVAAAERDGFHVRRVDISQLIAAATLLYDGALVAERYDAVGEFLDSPEHESAPGVDPVVRAIILAARDLPAHRFAGDLRRLRQYAARAAEVLADCDALVLPTVPRHPTLAEVADNPVAVNSEMGTYTNFCNLLDMCAVAVPAGETSDGAHFGISVIAPSERDAVVLDIAARLGGQACPRPWNADRARAVELGVFGAHLRGQPLESQLTSLGARWAGEITTAAEYRLVELSTTPSKPGLLHDEVNGRAIRGEKWEISEGALGRFLSALPAPMTLGAVQLADGRSIVGFSCDPEAANARLPIAADHWLERHAAGTLR